MNPFAHGFADELVKTAIAGGVLKTVGKAIVKHPLIAATGLMTAGATAASAAQAYRSGLRGGDKPRYLAAGPEGPSEAAYNNYSQLFEHPQTAKREYEISRWYRPNAFKR